MNRMNAGNLAIIFGYAANWTHLGEKELIRFIGQHLWAQARMWRMLVGKFESSTQSCRIPIRFSMMID